MWKVIPHELSCELAYTEYVLGIRIHGEMGIHVPEYLTALPPKEMLEQRLPQAMFNARRRFGQKIE